MTATWIDRENMRLALGKTAIIVGGNHLPDHAIAKAVKEAVWTDLKTQRFAGNTLERSFFVDGAKVRYVFQR